MIVQAVRIRPSFYPMLAAALLPAVSAFANQTAIALENARLYEQLQRHAEELERRVALKLGFSDAYPVTGQTYPRKVDAALAAAMGGIAASASKFANDIRLLMGLGELEEPIHSKQVGSSAIRSPCSNQAMARQPPQVSL